MNDNSRKHISISTRIVRVILAVTGLSLLIFLSISFYGFRKTEDSIRNALYHCNSLAEIHSTLKACYIILTILAGLILLGALYFGKKYADRISKPLAGLTETLDGMSLDEALKTPSDVLKSKINVHSGDEIEILSNTYLSMIAKLSDAYADQLVNAEAISAAEGRHTMDSRFIKAVSPICSYFYEVDLETMEVYVYGISGDDLLMQKTNMTYAEYIRHLSNAVVHPDNREAFEQNHLAINLDETRSGDDLKLITMYRRTVQDGTYKWFTAWMQPITDSDGHRRLIAFSQNIDTQFRGKQLAERQLKDANDELSNAITEAKRASSAKSEFLSNMSHDIRTPMNAIVGMITLAQNHISDSALVETYLHKMKAASDHLIGIINDILDMAYIDSGRLVLDEKECSISAIVKDVSDIITVQTDSKSQEYNVSLKNIDNDILILDEQRLKQVIINILGNAYKFTPAGGTICFNVSEENGSKLIMEFSDTGIGMKKEFVEHLFERFERANNSTVSKSEGTGLGMAITKSIVDKMNGTIEVTSADGVGTTFLITIPVRAGVQKTPEELAAAEKEDFFDFAGRNFLVAEDNELNAEISKTLLSELGANVDIASDGKMAVDMFRNSAQGYYDAILMDIKMPLMDGYAATRAIRSIKSEYSRSIPIIAATADAFKSDIEEAKRSGMNDHVSKPLNIRVLCRTLKKYMKNNG